MPLPSGDVKQWKKVAPAPKGETGAPGACHLSYWTTP
jgi:hypothetical protein